MSVQGDMGFMLEELLKLDHGLTDWEVEFIDSLDKRLNDKGRDLTDKQYKKLEQIYEENCR